MIKKINKRRRGQIVEEKKTAKKRKRGKTHLCSSDFFFLFLHMVKDFFRHTPSQRGWWGERAAKSLKRPWSLDFAALSPHHTPSVEIVQVLYLKFVNCSMEIVQVLYWTFVNYSMGIVQIPYWKLLNYSMEIVQVLYWTCLNYSKEIVQMLHGKCLNY